MDLAPFRQGRTLLVRFTFNTCDASGQNMVTTATSNACKWALTQVERELPGIRVNDYWVETGFSGDKQTSHAMLTVPRGVHVQAEAWIPESVLKSTLKVTVRVCVWGVGGEGKERSTRVGRFLSASLACGHPAAIAMQALAYWSLPTRSPLQVVCVSYIRLCMFLNGR